MLWDPRSGWCFSPALPSPCCAPPGRLQPLWSSVFQSALSATPEIKQHKHPLRTWRPRRAAYSGHDRNIAGQMSWELSDLLSGGLWPTIMHLFPSGFKTDCMLAYLPAPSPYNVLTTIKFKPRDNRLFAFEPLYKNYLLAYFKTNQSIIDSWIKISFKTIIIVQYRSPPYLHFCFLLFQLPMVNHSEISHGKF